MGHRDRQTALRLDSAARRCVAVAVTALAAAAPRAGAQLFDPPPEPVLAAERLVGIEAIPPRAPLSGGATCEIAIRFEIEPGWHLYWKNPGAGAAPIEIDLTVPEGFEVGPLRWPRPTRLPSPVGDMFCYEGPVTLFAPVTAPTQLAAGDASMTVRVIWAVCNNDRCLLGSLERPVTVATGPAPRGAPAPDETPEIAAARMRLPRPLEGADGASIAYAEGTLRVSGPAHGKAGADFFPHAAPGVVYGEPRIEIRGDRFELIVEVEVDEKNLLGREPVVGGVIGLGDRADDPSYEFEKPMSALRRT